MHTRIKWLYNNATVTVSVNHRMGILSKWVARFTESSHPLAEGVALGVTGWPGYTQSDVCAACQGHGGESQFSSWEQNR